MQTFKTHTGEIVSGERLESALNKVADDWAMMAYNIRKEDAYASHVTESQKQSDFLKNMAIAEEIREGNINSFTIWQRVDTALTDECIAFLP